MDLTKHVCGRVYWEKMQGRETTYNYLIKETDLYSYFVPKNFSKILNKMVRAEIVEPWDKVKPIRLTRKGKEIAREYLDLGGPTHVIQGGR